MIANGGLADNKNGDDEDNARYNNVIQLFIHPIQPPNKSSPLCDYGKFQS